jgi:hypothetical protein
MGRRQPGKPQPAPAAAPSPAKKPGILDRIKGIFGGKKKD